MKPSEIDSAPSVPESAGAGAFGAQRGAEGPEGASGSPPGLDEDEPWTLTCEGDPHSPYRHDWRRAPAAEQLNGETVYLCRDCGAIEVTLDDDYDDGHDLGWVDLDPSARFL